MNHPPFPEGVCQELAEELIDIATWLADGEQSPEEFRATVAAFESRKLRRFGLRLHSAVSEDGMVHFTMRCAETGEFCVSMDVHPATGKMVIQPGCA